MLSASLGINEMFVFWIDYVSLNVSSVIVHVKAANPVPYNQPKSNCLSMTKKIEIKDILLCVRWPIYRCYIC